MSQPDDFEPYPPENENITYIECAKGSRRTPDETLSQPCHACGHTSCRIGPQGPLPCDACRLIVYVRGIYDSSTGGLGSVVGQLNTRLAALETDRVTAAQFATLAERVTALETP